MKLRRKKLAIISTFACIVGLAMTTVPVFSESGNRDNKAVNAISVAANAGLSLWSKRHANYVKPSKAELKKRLTKLQYAVTQKDATERPFQNEYWNNKKEGIYVDIVSGEPLFSSKDKFRSGTGWPSFTRSIVVDAVAEKIDISVFGIRTELRSTRSDSHIGHIFDDGPMPTGLRYCINSAALRFIDKEFLVVEGYADFQSLFDN